MPTPKSNDADLIGFPIRIVVGKRGLADGVVEIHGRKTGETTKVATGNATSTIMVAIQT